VPYVPIYLYTHEPTRGYLGLRYFSEIKYFAPLN